MVSIYVLIDPETNKVRYVGKTVLKLSKRLSAHMNIPSKDKTYRANWIKQLKSKGLRPTIKLIDTIYDDANWPESERFWIAFYKDITDLVNLSSGGEGAVGVPITDEFRLRQRLRVLGKKASDETKQKMSEVFKKTWASFSEEKKAEIGAKRSKSLKAKGRKMSEENKRKLIEANTNRVVSESTKEKISKANRGRIRSEEFKKNISEINKGHIVTEETRNKLREVNLGRKHTEETKQKISAMRKGIKLTEEHKAKLSKSNKGRFVSEETRRKRSESMKKTIEEKRMKAENVNNDKDES